MKHNWIGVKQITKEQIYEIEKELNINLPEEYRSEIRNLNGGALPAAVYNDPFLGDIAYSRNVNLLKNGKFNIVQLFRSIDGGSCKYFPFGSVGNGDYFCFDLQTGKVVLYSHEEENIYAICDSFTEFIDGIKEI